MNDFKSYTANEGKDKKESSENANAEAVNLAAKIAKAFSGKSEGQIWQTILKQAEEGKRAGTLTNADLDNFYAAVSPMVDGFKRQKLKSVIAKLKSI